MSADDKSTRDSELNEGFKGEKHTLVKCVRVRMHLMIVLVVRPNIEHMHHVSCG